MPDDPLRERRRRFERKMEGTGVASQVTIAGGQNGSGPAADVAKAPPRVTIRRVRAPADPAPEQADLPATSVIREGERRHETLGRDALHRRLLASADVLAASIALLA